MNRVLSLKTNPLGWLTVAGLVAAAVTAAVTQVQNGGDWTAVAFAVVTAAASFLTRQKLVTPVADPRSAQGDPLVVQAPGGVQQAGG